MKIDFIKEESEIFEYQHSENRMIDLYNIVLFGKKDCIFWTFQLQEVFTAGKNTKQNIPNVKIIKTNRGGDITMHNEGQLMFYVICNLKKLQLDVHSFITMLEDITINTLNQYKNIFFQREQRGIWCNIDNEIYKIASIGICVKKYITQYGIAINLNNNLEPFDKIIPCGINHCQMISLEKILLKRVEISEFVKLLEINLINKIKLC